MLQTETFNKVPEEARVYGDTDSAAFSTEKYSEKEIIEMIGVKIDDYELNCLKIEHGRKYQSRGLFIKPKTYMIMEKIGDFWVKTPKFSGFY